MQERKLKKGEVLWAHGEPAATIAFVDTGRLGIKTEQGLIAVVGPPGIIGESALLDHDGDLPVRRAAVIAIEDSSVTEYPTSFIREAAGAGLPRKILRTLIGQTVTSACFVLAAHPDVPLVTQSMSALINSLSRSKSVIADVRTWNDFAPDFRYLIALRDVIDSLRDRLVPARFFVAKSDALLVASETVKTLVGDPEIQVFLDKFVAVERERIEAVESV